MKIIRDINTLTKHLELLKKNKIKIGFVPTMGGIHQGHQSLISNSKNKKLYTITSIFVNPSQFNDKKDYFNYPRNLNNDLKKIKKCKCDLVFIPVIKDIYPKKIYVQKLVKEYRNILCDNFRPGHFDGVTTVVKRLFSIIKPDFAFFGEKDFQQLMIIKKMITILNLPIKIIGCESVRNKNGLSFSSRFNLFKNSQKNILKKIGNIINKNLKKNSKNLNINLLLKELKKIKINKIEYIEIRNDKTLHISRNNPRLFISLYIDNVRIIDNFKLY